MIKGYPTSESCIDCGKIRLFLNHRRNNSIWQDCGNILSVGIGRGILIGGWLLINNDYYTAAFRVKMLFTCLTRNSERVEEVSSADKVNSCGSIIYGEVIGLSGWLAYCGSTLTLNFEKRILSMAEDERRD
jgi:hypothetical protein